MTQPIRYIKGPPGVFIYQLDYPEEDGGVNVWWGNLYDGKMAAGRSEKIAKQLIAAQDLLHAAEKALEVLTHQNTSAIYKANTIADLQSAIKASRGE